MKKFLRFCILVFLCVFIKVYAQSPGGVSGTEAWFMTKPIVSYSPDGNYKWIDFSGDNNILYYQSENDTIEYIQPRNKIRTFNFNPALNFKNNDFLGWFDLKYTSLSQSTIIGVFASRNFDRNNVLYCIDGYKTDDRVLENGKLLYSGDSLQYNNLSNNENLIFSATDSIRAINIVTNFHATQPCYSAWGIPQSSKFTIGEQSCLNADNDSSVISSSNSFNGYCPELVIYNRILTPFEKVKVEGYMAMKYGLTIDNSYYDSNGNLLWDSDNNPFNNRIVAYGRDLGSNFLQLLSCTSYEEAPNYTWLEQNSSDSYYNNNSLNFPSYNRLLVIGKELSNGFVNNGEFVICGDNNASIGIYDSTKVMSRIWELKTNSTKKTKPFNGSVWNGYGLKVINKGERNHLAFDGNNPNNCYAVTKRMINNNGIISFDHHYGREYAIGFIQDTLNISSYSAGYRFFKDGRIARFTGSTENYLVIYHIQEDANIKIQITENGLLKLYIRNIIFDSFSAHSFSNSKLFGYARIYPNQEIYGIDNVTVGGTHDNGNYIELGFIHHNHIFNPRNNDAYLIIDPNGNGVVDFNNAKYIKATGYDEIRDKLIFNNVYWDIDNNGTDNFTFGCVDCLKYNIEITDATDLNSNDGKISINIKAGTAPYGYSLVDNSPGSPIIYDRNECFMTDSIDINNVIPKTYDLTIYRLGGYEVYGEASEYGHDRYVKSNNMINTGNMYWIHNPEEVSNNDVYIAGLGNNKEVQYGFRLIGNKVYAVTPSGAVSVMTLNKATKLSLIYSGGKLNYLCGTQVLYQTPLSGYFYGIVQALSNSCQIYNLCFENCQDFICSPGMYAEYIEPCQITDEITVGSNSYNPQIIEAPSSVEETILSNPQFKVYPSELGYGFIAELYQDNPTPATLAIFDATGKLIHSSEFKGSDNTRKKSFVVPTTGVYIVKAITYDNEYTQKIISK